MFNTPLEDVVIECFNKCDAKKIAEDYILKRANFAFGHQKVTVEKNGVEKYSTTIYDYLKNIKVENSPIINSSKVLRPEDGALSCEHDADFSCAQWNENRDLAILADYVNSSSFSITVTQRMLDGYKDAANLIAAILLATPSAKFGQLLNVFTVDIISDKVMAVLVAYVGFEISGELAGLILPLLNNNDLQIGDVINMTGGKVTSINRAGSSSGDGAGSGGSYDGSTDPINNGMTLADVFADFASLTVVCRLVSTKSADGVWVTQEVCYIQ